MGQTTQSTPPQYLFGPVEVFCCVAYFEPHSSENAIKTQRTSGIFARTRSIDDKAVLSKEKERHSIVWYWQQDGEF